MEDTGGAGHLLLRGVKMVLHCQGLDGEDAETHEQQHQSNPIPHG